MSGIRPVLALICVVLLALVISAPARLLGLIVSPDTFVLQGFGGSIWNGSAAQCLVRVGHGYVHLGSVQWRLSPLSLLVFSPSVQLQSRRGDQKFSGKITLRGAGSFDLHELEATVSAQLLRQYTPFHVEGDFSLQAAHLVIRDGLPYSGSGRVLWQSAAWISPGGSRKLGSYAVDFAQLEEQPLQGKVVTIAGPVEASGDIELDGTGYVVDILLDSASGLDVALQQAMSLFAQPVGSGFRIQLNGEI